jgi:hypothetical protein
MPIGRHSFWRMTDDIDNLLEKALGCLHVSLLDSAWNQPDSHRDRWPERESTIPFDVDVGFINVPGPRLFALGA